MIDIFVYFLIIILILLAVWYIFNIIQSLNSITNGCVIRNINDHDCRTVRIVRDYLIWCNVLLFVTLLASILSILLSLCYGSEYISAYDGWLLYGITFLLGLITTGAYFLGLWSYELLSTVVNRDEVRIDNAEILIATSIIILINAILFISSGIFSRMYRLSLEEF